MTTQRIEITHTGKWERVLASFLVFAAFYLFAQWLNTQELFENLTFVIMVAIVHLVSRWNPPADVAPRAGGFARVIQIAQAEVPLLATWTGQGSRTAELLKGIAKGVILLLCREVLIWILMLFPSASLMWVQTIATILVVGLAHLAENWRPRIMTDREATGFAKIVQAAQEESPLIAMWTGQGTHAVELAKGLVKGFVVMVGKVIMVACSIFFLSWWFAGAVAAIYIAYLIIPNSFRSIIDKILNPQREPAAAVEASDLPAADLLKGHQAA